MREVSGEKRSCYYRRLACLCIELCVREKGVRTLNTPVVVHPAGNTIVVEVTKAETTKCRLRTERFQRGALASARESSDYEKARHTAAALYIPRTGSNGTTLTLRSIRDVTRTN
jgi:hypothetical protein